MDASKLRAADLDQVEALAKDRGISNPGVIKERIIGERKYKLLTLLEKELNKASANGVNPNYLAKFLKINIHQVWKVKTKEISGLIGRVAEFNKAR